MRGRRIGIRLSIGFAAVRAKRLMTLLQTHEQDK